LSQTVGQNKKMMGLNYRKNGAMTTKRMVKTNWDETKRKEEGKSKRKKKRRKNRASSSFLIY